MVPPKGGDFKPPEREMLIFEGFPRVVKPAVGVSVAAPLYFSWGWFLRRERFFFLSARVSVLRSIGGERRVGETQFRGGSKGGLFFYEFIMGGGKHERRQRKGRRIESCVAEAR